MPFWGDMLVPWRVPNNYIPHYKRCIYGVDFEGNHPKGFPTIFPMRHQHVVLFVSRGIVFVFVDPCLLPTPPTQRTPPEIAGLIQGLFNHLFLLIRPYWTHISEGCTLGGVGWPATMKISPPSTNKKRTTPPKKKRKHLKEWKTRGT